VAICDQVVPRRLGSNHLTGRNGLESQSTDPNSALNLNPNSASSGGAAPAAVEQAVGLGSAAGRRRRLHVWRRQPWRLCDLARAAGGEQRHTLMLLRSHVPPAAGYPLPGRMFLAAHQDRTRQPAGRASVVAGTANGGACRVKTLWQARHLALTHPSVEASYLRLH